MENEISKKAKWLSTTTFTNGIDIQQRIFSKNIVNFIRSRKLTLHLDLNKVHSYVLPYILEEASKQDYKLKTVEITVLPNEN